jgi:hypothetical protein
LQDRLVKELRLRSISTVGAANAYLPEFIRDFNSRFSVEPRSSEDAHRPLAADEDLDRILALCERRTLSKNLTLSYGSVIYQIETKRADYTMRGAHVEVRETGAGVITIEYRGRALGYRVHREQEREQARVADSKALDVGPRRRARKRYHPPMSHPWRYFDYTENSMEAMERRGDICILRK